MLDTITLQKLTEYYRGILNLLEAPPLSMEDLYQGLTVEKPASPENVLRELSPEEASLFFADFSVFQAVLRKRGEYIAQGYSRYSDAPGGILLIMLDTHVGAMGRLLTLTASMEFAQDSRIQGLGKAVRIEIVDDALCFVSFKLADETSVREMVGQAVGSAINEFVIGGRHKPAQAMGDKFDLEHWIPDAGKVQ